MDPILELADRFRLVVIEDAAKRMAPSISRRKKSLAQPARWTCGRIQLYPGKNLGACGEGGAITTNDEKVARASKMLRDHGQSGSTIMKSKATTAGSMPSKQVS